MKVWQGKEEKLYHEYQNTLSKLGGPSAQTNQSSAAVPVDRLCRDKLDIFCVLSIDFGKYIYGSIF